MIDKYDEEYKRCQKDSHILLNIKMIIWLKKTTLNYEKADLDQLIEKEIK